MNKNFDSALKNAFEQEFCWLDDFDNPYSKHEFSSQFESKMRAIIPKAEFAYVSIGKRRFRKTLLAALVALFALIITGCAFTAHYLVEWHEEQNDKQGTLDVTFDVDDRLLSTSGEALQPQTPSGYTITDEYADDSSRFIYYSNSQGELILYTYMSGVENMGISIDNEDADFEETTILGYKGYRSSKDGINALYWSDGKYFYELQGTCKMDILWQMTESMVE